MKKTPNSIKHSNTTEQLPTKGYVSAHSNAILDEKLSEDLNQLLIEKSIEVHYSGTVFAKQNDSQFKFCNGDANRSEQLQNTINTRFGIASGCKLFTAIAIGQLVDKGLLTFDTRLSDCLSIKFPQFDPHITIHHLLTHSSGIPDYFDEAVMDDFEDLWKQYPMYHMRTLTDFLPLFLNQAMMFSPGERFHYNNAGFIVLGLVVEQQTGESFTNYVEKNIFAPCGMKRSGYFSMDCLPSNTAMGYIDEEDGSWRTNTFALPIKGGADGGAYVTAPDMVRLWESLFGNLLLESATLNALLTPHIATDEDDEHYGYGIWINKSGGDIFKYHVMGYDPGVCFHSGYYPQSNLTLVVTCNKSSGAYSMTETIEKHLLD